MNLKNGALAALVGTAAIAYPASASANSYIIGINKSVSMVGSAKKTQQLGGKKIRPLALIHAQTAELSAAQASRLRQSPGVRYVEPVQKVRVMGNPTDPMFSSQWGLADINLPSAWNAGVPASITVAVVDTGVKMDHPDLAASLWTNAGEIAGNGIDDDRNGKVDDVHGYDFQTNSGNVVDLNGHGTHVAGIVGATPNNGIGISGVTPSAKIMGVRFMDASGSGTTTGAVAAMQYAVSNGAKIINNSWGGSGYSQALSDAIGAAQSQGVLVINAAGNSGKDIGTNPEYPAADTHPNTIAVAATTQTAGLAGFSNYGSGVAIGAPGVSILSTIPNGAFGVTADYAQLSGTSMATPMVSGAAAWLWGMKPSAGWQEIKQALIGGGTATPALSGKISSGKRLNLLGSWQLLGNTQTPTSAPSMQSVPQITRSVDRLTCNPGTWSGNPTPTIAYTWKRGSITISSAQYYDLVSVDQGQTLTCTVIASNQIGSASAQASYAVPSATSAPSVQTSPQISRSAKDLLACSPGTWSGNPTSYSYLWRRDGVLRGTGSQYQLGPSDVGKTVSCTVTASNRVGSGQATVSIRIDKLVTPTWIVQPQLVQAGNQVLCLPGAYQPFNATVSYAWKRDETAVSAGAWYRLTSADLGHMLSCTVTLDNGGSTAQASVSAAVSQARGSVKLAKKKS